jgi:hypothetical protein
MPKPCSVCIHKYREEIDRALLAGVAYRTLAAQYNLSASALCRHMRHLARYREAMMAHEERRFNDAILDKLDLMEHRLGEIYKSAGDHRSLRVALDCVKENIKVLGLLEKLRGKKPLR